jgi:hypothetical protein
MIHKIEIKSLVLGAVAGGITVLLLGAATSQKLTSEIAPLRFRVLTVTRHGEPVDGKQEAVIRLEPSHLQERSLKSYEDFCLQQSETRELTVITKVDSAFHIPANQIITFQASSISEPDIQQIQQLTPSSK